MSKLFSNTTDLQEVLEALQTKAAVSKDPVLQDKTVSPTTSQQTITADSGYDGLDTVIVNTIPSDYIIPSGTKTITANGTHDVKNYASATVNVAREDVSAETNAYTNKLATLETAITQLETELQGKASGGSGGGGSVETCTVTVNCNPWKSILATIFNGEIETYSRCEGNGSSEVVTIENVVCDSPIMIYPAFPAPAYEVSGAEFIHEYTHIVFKVTASAGENATVTIYSTV